MGTLVVYTIIFKSQPMHDDSLTALTTGKESSNTSGEMLPKIPAIAETIVKFN